VVRLGVVALVALLAASLAVAAPSRPKPALATSCGVVSDSEPTWSPSGRALLFTRQRAAGAVSSVYRIGADGRNERRLTPLGEYAYGGAWSADGTRIAYTTFDLAAVARIVVAFADGTGAQVVASFQGMRFPPETFLTWSRDNQLAYVDFENGLRTPQRLLARGATQPAWSPDGFQIAYVGTGGITVADADGGNAHVIADGGQPVWSPDGTRVAYTAAPGVGVHVIGADGTGDRLVDPLATSAAWAPDGRHVLDVLYVGRGLAHNAVRSADLSTGRVRTVTHDASVFYGSDDFQPAVARTIAFTAEPEFGGAELRFVQLDGKRERRLTYHCVRSDDSAGRALFGTWLPDIINSRNGYRDRVSCGGGYDVTFVDRRDRVGRGCEVVRRG
jgi:dipeptidyl aminopeptidase/acylaminoacyl peptidase